MFKSVRHLSLLAAAIVCSGCVTAEGVSIGSQPYISSTFVKYGGHPDADNTEADTRVTELIVVGTVSAFRQYDADDKTKEYERYVKSFDAWGINRPPQLSAEAFSRTMRGWTNIKIFGVPLLAAAYMKALVPEKIADEVEFEPVITTAMFQASGDLVAAKTNPDGALVIESLLCRDRREADFAGCSKRYRRGVFDAKTGLKIKGKLRTDPDGPRIDPATYLRVNDDAAKTGVSLPAAN